MKYAELPKSMLLILVNLSLFIACEAHVQEDSLTDITADCNTEISFTSNIQPIIATNCLNCHNGGQFPNLSSYSGVSENASQVRSQVVSGRMPQGGTLTTEEIEMIRCWIDLGALNN